MNLKSIISGIGLKRIVAGIGLITVVINLILTFNYPSKVLMAINGVAMLLCVVILLFIDVGGLE